MRSSAKLGGNLLLGAIGQVETNMRFEHLAHQGVDAAADRSQQHELVAAVAVGVSERSIASSCPRSLRTRWTILMVSRSWWVM